MIGFGLCRTTHRLFSKRNLLAWLVGLATSCPVVAADFLLVPGQSHIEFRIAHLVIGVVEGRFETMTGRFRLDSSGKALDDLESTIATESLNTGIGARDEELMGKAFLNAGRHPDISFSAKKCEFTGTGTKVEGILTLRGVARQVTFHAGIPEARTDAEEKKLATLKGYVTLKRNAIGLKFADLRDKDETWVGDEVQIAVTLIGREP